MESLNTLINDLNKPKDELDDNSTRQETGSMLATGILQQASIILSTIGNYYIYIQTIWGITIIITAPKKGSLSNGGTPSRETLTLNAKLITYTPYIQRLT